MEAKRLHEAIKALWAELDRVNLEIQRIEATAEAVVRDEQADSDSSGPKPQVDVTAGQAD